MRKPFIVLALSSLVVWGCEKKEPKPVVADPTAAPSTTPPPASAPPPASTPPAK